MQHSLTMWFPFHPSLFLSRSTPASALATKATSKVPLSPRAPWDTQQRPSRAPSTPIRPTVTEAPSLPQPADASVRGPAPCGQVTPPSVRHMTPSGPSSSRPLDLDAKHKNQKQTNRNNPKRPRWAFFFFSASVSWWSSF